MKDHYRGWDIEKVSVPTRADTFVASRGCSGVRMNTNTLAGIKRMIDQNNWLRRQHDNNIRT